MERIDLLRYADELGLDLDRFEEDMDSEHVERRIQDDLDHADLMNVHGTPTSFVNGSRYEGLFDARSLIVSLGAIRPEGSDAEGPKDGL